MINYAFTLQNDLRARSELRPNYDRYGVRGVTPNFFGGANYNAFTHSKRVSLEIPPISTKPIFEEISTMSAVVHEIEKTYHIDRRRSGGRVYRDTLM